MTKFIDTHNFINLQREFALTNPTLNGHQKIALSRYLQRLGDDALILGHRLSEWCGHGPILEEDIALANIALDNIGQATMFLRYAGEIEGKGRNEDTFAYWRSEQEFRNVRLVEVPNGDFGFTICRQFLFAAYAYPLYTKLCQSTFDTLRGIAAKAVKEVEYHLRHAREWMLRLGDGTEESHRRVQEALNEQWDMTRDLFLPDADEVALITAGLVPDRKALRAEWLAIVEDVVSEATLQIPTESKWASDQQFRNESHSEFLGHLLAEMQIVARSHPGAVW